MTAINMKLSKLLENLFKGIKSDAIPRAPRNTDETVSPEARTENGDLPEEQEPEIIIESVSDDEIKKEKKSNKSSKKFFKSKKRDYNDDDDDDEEDLSKSSQEKRGSAGSVNVQAAGNVYNVLNCKGVRLGNDYYFGPVTMPANKPGKEKKYDEDQIEKDNFIRLLMEAKIKPDHDYMDYISKNLGKNWHSVFRALGFTQGRIETAEINAASYDISEARYKLLLDWVNNDDDGSLGRLATLLWEEGERSIVKDLSVMYKKACKKSKK